MEIYLSHLAERRRRHVVVAVSPQQRESYVTPRIYFRILRGTWRLFGEEGEKCVRLTCLYCDVIDCCY